MILLTLCEINLIHIYHKLTIKELNNKSIPILTKQDMVSAFWCTVLCYNIPNEEDFMERSKKYWPKFINPKDEPNHEYFIDLVNKGLVKQYGILSKEIVDRAEKEIKTICDLGLLECFLIWNDIVSFAKKNDIAVGTGRGSSVGSLVCYALEITKIDPIKNGLIFERFINKERLSIFGIDIDIDYKRRNEIFEYIKDKYGAECTAKASTYYKVGAKLAIKEAVKSLELPYEITEKICKFIPSNGNPYLKLKDYIGLGHFNMDIIPELKLLYSTNAEVKKVVNHAIEIQNQRRKGSNHHPSAILIASCPIREIVPISHITEDGYMVADADIFDCENAGILCLDVMGLNIVGTIHNTSLVVKRSVINFDINTIDYSDKKVFKYLSEGFLEKFNREMKIAYYKNYESDNFDDEMLQRILIDSAFFQENLDNWHIDKFDDIIASIALYHRRPDMIFHYVNGKKSRTNNSIDKIFSEILSETYGIILYQEQVMKILMKIGGFSAEKADISRRDICKIKHKNIATMKHEFVKAAVEKSYLKEIANSIFDEIERVTPHAFLKSHTIAYATLAYQAAYLSYYFSEEYSNNINNFDKEES